MILELELQMRAPETGLDRTAYTEPFLRAAAIDAAMADTIGSQRPAVGIDTETYPHLEDTRVAFIGACAGGLAAAYLVQRGFPATNMHLIDPRGRRAGIWETGLADGGINNPKPLYFPPDHKLDIRDRRGTTMRNFKRDIVDKHLIDASFVQDRAIDLTKNTSDGSWVVQTNNERYIEADYVVVSTGTPRPRRIDGKRIRTNLDTAPENVAADQLIVERWQRTLTDEELGSGRPFVLVGLGNSTGTMLKQIYGFQTRTGQTVPFTVVTDLSRAAVQHPTRATRNHPSLFRDPRIDYLTGYSGDLGPDAAVYYQALQEGKIITDVTALRFDADTDMLHINSDRGRVRPIETPHVFALVGYERDATLFKSAGAIALRGLLKKTVDGPHIRQMDGAVRTQADGYRSNLFALGAAAATRDNPAAAVMPKVVAALPGLALTQAVREYARQRAA